MENRWLLQRRQEYKPQQDTYNKKSGVDNYRNPSKQLGIL